MGKRSLLAIFGGILLVMCISSKAFADRRSYVWTYEYQTMPKGMAEIEYYLTTKVPDTAKSNINTWEHQVELEYGITDRWDISLYQIFKQTNTASSSKFEYNGFKIRTRYRFGEKGKYFIDPELYLEYIRNDDLSKPNIFEGKLILAKDLGKFNIAYNQILKQELEYDGETEHEYAFGASYEISPKIRLGLESKGNYTKDKYSLGPTVSLATEDFWVSLGVLSALNERTDDVQARMIIGIPF